MGKQKKKTHHSKPHGDGTSYVQRHKARDNVMVQATMDTYLQFCVDCLCLAANEEFGFGEQRLRKLVRSLNAQMHKWGGMLDERNEEAGYLRSKLDEALKGIGVLDAPEHIRYEWIEDRA